MPNKKEIRQNQIAVRNGLLPQVRAEKSKKILESLEALDLFINAKNILFYYTNGSEVNTVPLIEKITKHKKVFLPRIVGKNEFIALEFTGQEKLKKGAYDIPEPSLEEERGDEKNLDLIIVPGVAFDKEGVRIGMGKGFYDRFLSKMEKVPRIGLAFNEQMLDQLPKDPYDENVDIIITDKTILNFKR